MSEQSPIAGRPRYLFLRDDGDAARVLFVGAPHMREVCFIGGAYVPFNEARRAIGHKPSLRVSMNVILVPSAEPRVFEQGLRFGEDLVRLKARYRLCQWMFEICRHGAAGDPNTTYSIEPVESLSDDLADEIEQAPTYDLAAYFDAIERAAATAAAAGRSGSP